MGGGGARGRQAAWLRGGAAHQVHRGEEAGGRAAPPSDRRRGVALLRGECPPADLRPSGAAPIDRWVPADPASPERASTRQRRLPLLWQLPRPPPSQPRRQSHVREAAGARAPRCPPLPMRFPPSAARRGGRDGAGPRPAGPSPPFPSRAASASLARGVVLPLPRASFAGPPGSPEYAAPPPPPPRDAPPRGPARERAPPLRYAPPTCEPLL